MFKRPLAVFLAAGLALAGLPLAAQPGCGAREAMVDRLASVYSEELTAAGLQGRDGDQRVLEIWASERTGTFTVLLTTAAGESCIVASGTGFLRAPSGTIPEGTDG